MNHKKIIICLTLTLTLFSGCILNKVKEDTTKLIEDGKTSYNNVEKKVNEVKTNLEEGKARIDETINDVQTAVTKIKETKEAIKDIAK